MPLKKPYIPEEVDADVALSVIMPHIDLLTAGHVRYDYKFLGTNGRSSKVLHRGDEKREQKRNISRTAIGDAVNIDIKEKKKKPTDVTFSLLRDSLYHILPEYLFHPIDRYAGSVKAVGGELKLDYQEFEKCYDEQEEQEKNALAYFKPFDKKYQDLRVSLQKWLSDHVFKGNMFLANYITAGIAFNRENPFIMAVYPCLPWLRNHRGNKQMTEVALRYAFADSCTVEYAKENYMMDFDPQIHSTINGDIDDLFCGSTFPTVVSVWRVSYQTTIGTEERLRDLLVSINEFAGFFTQWFLHIEDKLELEFGDFKEPPILTSQQAPTGIFLNYSTQLL